MQEAVVDGKLELEKVDTAMDLADVCTKAFVGNGIRELCRLARVYVCCSEGTMGCLKGRVDFTCLFCCNQTHFASAVGHELVDPKCRTRSIMEKGFM